MGQPNKYFCGECGKELTPQEKPCSTCGSVKRHIQVFIEEKLVLRDSLKGTIRDKLGKTTRKFYSRNKLSAFGKEARENLDIDIKGNRKFHHVEEQDENGNWHTVHHEDEPLKKKQI